MNGQHEVGFVIAVSPFLFFHDGDSVWCDCTVKILTLSADIHVCVPSGTTDRRMEGSDKNRRGPSVCTVVWYVQTHMPCGQGYAKTGLRARARVEPYPLTGSVEDPISERYLDQGILNIERILSVR